MSRAEELRKLMSELTSSTDQYSAFVRDLFDTLPPLLVVDLFVYLVEQNQEADSGGDIRKHLAMSMALVHFASLLGDAGTNLTGPFKGAV